MNNLLRRLFRFRNRKEEIPPEAEMAKSMVRDILATRADELSCEECYIQLDQFVEMHLSNASPQQALPLVEDHLARCKDCREEFEILLDALRQTI